METIILAGGRGTRLRSVVADVPKPLAPVAGRPFLFRLLDRLAGAGNTHVVLAVGHLGDMIVDAVGERWQNMKVSYSTEEEPLGTGGALCRAMSSVEGADALVLNGDSYVEVDFAALLAVHRACGHMLTMTIVRVPDAARYGRVEVSNDTVGAFREKGGSGPGLINAGVYALDRSLFGSGLPPRFSFENDFLYPRLATIQPRAFLVDGLFVDIGVPDDYARAQALFA